MYYYLAYQQNCGKHPWSINQKEADHSLLPFCWESTKLLMTSMANWWTFLFCSFASESMASYVSLSTKSFKLDRDDLSTKPSHFSTVSCRLSKPCRKAVAKESKLPWNSMICRWNWLLDNSKHTQRTQHYALRNVRNFHLLLPSYATNENQGCIKSMNS